MEAMDLLVALGPVVSPIIAVLGSVHLTNYRIGQLEEKVDKHNQVVERTFRLEGRMDEAEHDIRDLKKSGA